MTTSNHLPLRSTFGKFATGVCVVIGVDQNLNKVGITINSYTSVSLDPALALWCIGKESRLLSFFKNCTEYTINILNSEQSEISGFYARRGDHTVDESHVEYDESGSPRIKGAIATLKCEPAALHEAGDHFIVLGRIIDHSETLEQNPLIFFSGKYLSHNACA